ncbi:hypothetical protein ACH5RR_039940 [Cinchona calisaya]|uniref:Uncharacterized protein n=1 Tax=Cinchona calisaya TaxID=153742 RepID=A0ABD2XZS0_9GENT
MFIHFTFNQVYNFLNGLKEYGDNPSSGIQLYFFDTEEELSKRLDASPSFHESTTKLLMNILGQNAYAKFFKGLRDLPNIEEHTIVLNSNPGLDQRVYSLPSTFQVPTIWTESDDQNLDRNAHI